MLVIVHVDTTKFNSHNKEIIKMKSVLEIMIMLLKATKVKNQRTIMCMLLLRKVPLRAVDVLQSI